MAPSNIAFFVRVHYTVRSLLAFMLEVSFFLATLKRKGSRYMLDASLLHPSLLDFGWLLLQWISL